MYQISIIFITIAVSVLLSIFLVVSIPKFMYVCEYSDTHIILTRLENISCAFSAICLIVGLILLFV
jgi:hypothetical protein